MELKRGDLVIIAVSGDYGKPRPCLVIQSDAFNALRSVTVLRLTSDIRNLPLLRITVEPNRSNGLEKLSQIMIDKAATLPKSKIGKHIGRVDKKTMLQVNRALIQFLELRYR